MVLQKTCWLAAIHPMRQAGFEVQQIVLNLERRAKEEAEADQRI